MKRILLFLLLSIFAFPLELDAQRKKSSDVYVKAYYRADGTYVKGHYRSAPNSTNRDNFSTRGNVNPYTGKSGTVDPDNKTYYYTGNNRRVLSNTSSSKSNNSKNQSYNEQALKDAYVLFSQAGYNGSFEKFVELITNNPDALSLSYTLFTENGYTGTLDDFSGLMGVKKKLDSFKPRPFNNSQSKASYFYALNNRYIGLENPIRFGSYSSGLDIDFGIESDGGALMSLKYIHGSYSNRAQGDLVLYLEDGSKIICYDRKLYDNINGDYYTYYRVTPDEIKRLRNYDVHAVQVVLLYMTYGSGKTEKVLLEPKKRDSQIVFFTSSWINMLYKNHYN